MNKALKRFTSLPREKRFAADWLWSGFWIGALLLALPAEHAAAQCSLTDSNVESVTAFNAQFTNGGDPRLLGSADGCRIKIHPNIGSMNFGIEIVASLPSTLPDPVKVHVKFHSNEPNAAPVELHLQRAGQTSGDFDLIKRWSLESDGTTDRMINLTRLANNANANISDYIHPGNLVVFRLIAFSGMIAHGNCDESLEFDRGG